MNAGQSKTLSYANATLLAQAAAEYGTPVYVYDAEQLRNQLRSLKAFDTIRFAQKACPNTHVQRVLRDEGALVDCVSLGELERALKAGFLPGTERSEIVYTADVITPATLERVVELKVPVNAGSEHMLKQVGECAPGHPVWLRLNPGFGSGHSKKVNTGGESSKHGIWHENLAATLKIIDEHKLDLVGIHMHIGSGADIEHLKRVCDAMVAQVKLLDRDIRAVSGGGGLTIPYRAGEGPIDVGAYYDCWNNARKQIEERVGHAVHLEIEPGRYLAAEAGRLVAEVRAHKISGGNHFTLVDAGFNDLMRPAMYGSWHEITVLRGGQPSTAPQRDTLVAGPLCESGDVFTQGAGGDVLPRSLPEAAVGDLVVFHDAGAYGSSMSSNYNSRPLAPEVLIDGGELRLIRRAQRIDELLALEDC